MRAMKLTAPKRSANGKFMMGITPSSIDKYSRIAFPSVSLEEAMNWVL